MHLKTKTKKTNNECCLNVTSESARICHCEAVFPFLAYIITLYLAISFPYQETTIIFKIHSSFWLLFCSHSTFAPGVYVAEHTA